MRAIMTSSVTALVGCLCLANPGFAQPASPPTPTTRILAIGTLNRSAKPIS